MPLSEFDLIRRYFTHPARGAVLGVGDDAALVRVRRGMELAISADMLVSGRHFHPATDPESLGYKALAVNLSDMAAMGATPRWATLCLALPRADPRWLSAFARGFMRLARSHRVDLVGGDTTRGPLALSVQILGEVAAGTALRRDGARVGDDVWVSGMLGNAALALTAIDGRIRLAPRERLLLEARLHAPVPRVALGTALRGIARSAIDISDGLLADLGHICERSATAAVIELDRVPHSTVMARYLPRPTALGALLAGGDDYELCFTASPRRRRAIAPLAVRHRIKLSRIGRIVAARRGGSLISVVDANGRPVKVESKGYDHFS
jgi:thiamine-monophosphate kinase